MTLEEKIKIWEKVKFSDDKISEKIKLAKTLSEKYPYIINNFAITGFDWDYATLVHPEYAHFHAFKNILFPYYDSCNAYIGLELDNVYLFKIK